MRDRVKKTVEVFEMLQKMEPNLKQHLDKIRQVAPDSARVLASKIFGDSLVPGIGNRAAYEDFLSRPRAGVHIELDANDFGSINKIHGMAQGDQALKAMGHALKRAARAHRLKSWRVGGDEFKFHADTPEQAHGFVRQARKELEALPPVGGTHHHSVSIGLGGSPDQAGLAVIQAKQAKKAAQYPLGQAKTHVYSSLPGAAGHVPVYDEPVVPPGIQAPRTTT